MDIRDKKLQIQGNLRKLSKNEYINKRPELSRMVNNLESAIHQDCYKILVLGEFKRGKSTLVNALLGRSIVPMDVLPETATLNEVVYSDTPFVKVFYSNGLVEDGTLSAEFLQRFSANAENSQAHLVDKIQMGYPLPFLQDKITLVDTPGVADLDETRCDITYQIIPQANAVIFLLDANTPLTQSEKDFLVDRLIPQGIDNILFLLNKYDFIDEEEDEGFLEEVEHRLRITLKDEAGNDLLKEIRILPISAKMALEGHIYDKESLVHESGLVQVQERLTQMLSKGDVETEKVESYNHKYQILLQHIAHIMSEDIALQSLSVKELEVIAKNIQSLLDAKSEVKEKISLYVDSMRTVILGMTQKSIKCFQNKLITNVHEDVDSFKGTELNEYVNKTLARYIKREYENWIATYTPQVQILLKKLLDEIEIGLMESFEETVHLNTYVNEFQVNDTNIADLQIGDMDSLYKKNIMARLGILSIVGLVVASTPFTLVGSMVGNELGDKFKNRLFKGKLESVKKELLPQLEAAIIEGINKIFEDLESYIVQQCQDIESASNEAYETLLEAYQKKTQHQLKVNEDQSEQARTSLDDLKKQYNELVTDFF